MSLDQASLLDFLEPTIAADAITIDRGANDAATIAAWCNLHHHARVQFHAPKYVHRDHWGPGRVTIPAHIATGRVEFIELDNGRAQWWKITLDEGPYSDTDESVPFVYNLLLQRVPLSTGDWSGWGIHCRGIGTVEVIEP